MAMRELLSLRCSEAARCCKCTTSRYVRADMYGHTPLFSVSWLVDLRRTFGRALDTSSLSSHRQHTATFVQQQKPENDLCLKNICTSSLALWLTSCLIDTEQQPSRGTTAFGGGRRYWSWSLARVNSKTSRERLTLMEKFPQARTAYVPHMPLLLCTRTKQNLSAVYNFIHITHYCTACTSVRVYAR